LELFALARNFFLAALSAFPAYFLFQREEARKRWRGEEGVSTDKERRAGSARPTGEESGLRGELLVGGTGIIT
jgi:hypothetical protein